MNNFEKKLKNAAEEKYALSRDERIRMKEHVHAFMKMKPIRSRQDLRYAFSSFYVAMRRTGAVVAVFAIIFVMGGLSAAANNALPGDVLYPIKHVLEDARSTLSFSSESKAEWEVRRLERRVDEAALLEGMGELDHKKRARIEEAIDEHAQRATELAAKVEDNDSIAALNVRTNVAIELESREGRDGDDAISPMAAALPAQDAVAEERAAAPEALSSADAIDEPAEEEVSEYKEAATQQRTAVRTLLARIDRQKALADVGSDTTHFEMKILTPLASLRSEVKEAEALFEEGAFEVAHNLFTEIHKKARTLDLVLKRQSWKGDEVSVEETEMSEEIEENGEDIPVLGEEGEQSEAIEEAPEYTPSQEEGGSDGLPEELPDVLDVIE